MKIWLGVFGMALLLSSSGCTDRAVDKEAEAQKLMQLSREWSAMVEAGNLEESIDFWADDAILLPPDSPMLTGKDAIREYVMDAAAIPGFRISWSPESAYVSESGDIAYLIEQNLTEMDGEDGQRIEIPGKVVTIWRKEPNGEWKNIVEMWNAAPVPAN